MIIDESARPAGDQRFRSLREVEAAGAAAHERDQAVFEKTWRQVGADQAVTLLGDLA